MPAEHAPPTAGAERGGRRLWAPQAWIGGRWREAVCLSVDAQGCWSEITIGVAAPDGAEPLAGPALPGLVDGHSHAFQRAFAGLAERRDPQHAHDDFWSWRAQMYRVADRIDAAALQAVAAQLFVELLHGGYTQVCEFHYLRHPPAGADAGADPLASSRALAEAAATAGIGLTLLPVLYERAGFTEPQLRPAQRRFACSADDVIALRDGIRQARWPLVDAGVAVHSLRAAAPASLRRLVGQLDDAPLHIHVAEQTGEVDDCVAATGQRPIEWLAGQMPLDARWQLVHATHATASEIDAVAASGAGVVLCPSTEADLGDGVPDLPRWLAAGGVGSAGGRHAAGVPLALGSDSQVLRDWPGELRLLEQAQRLLTRRRNVAASDAEASTAARLFERVLRGGGAAAGHGRWGFEVGARADLLVLDRGEPALLGVPDEALLDALVFAGAARPFRDVLVAGRWAVRDGRHPAAAAVAQAYLQAVQRLRADAPEARGEP